MALQIGHVLLGVLQHLLELLFRGAVCLVFDHLFQLGHVLRMFGQCLVGRRQVVINLLNRFFEVVFFLQLLGKFFGIFLMRLGLLWPLYEFFSLFLDWRSSLTFCGVYLTLLRPLDERIIGGAIRDDLVLLRCFGSNLINHGVAIVDINKTLIEI